MSAGTLVLVACTLLLPIGMGGLWAVPAAAHAHCSGDMSDVGECANDEPGTLAEVLLPGTDSHAAKVTSSPFPAKKSACLHLIWSSAGGMWQLWRRSGGFILA